MKPSGGYSHTMIVGATETGKTTLAKITAAQGLAAGLAAIVYDPMLSDWGDGACVADNWPDFLKLLEENGRSGALVFVDEADTCLSISDRPNWWLLTRGRHYGFRVHLITQRPQLVAPTVRGMCATLFCFRVSSSDAAMLSNDFTDERLKSASGLAQGEFLHSRWLNGARELSKYNVFAE